MALVVKNWPASAGDVETWVPSLGQEDSLEEETATHSSILAWRIPWIEQPGVLQSIGLQSQTRLKWLSMHRLKTKRKRSRTLITKHDLFNFVTLGSHTLISMMLLSKCFCFVIQLGLPLKVVYASHWKVDHVTFEIRFCFHLEMTSSLTIY